MSTPAPDAPRPAPASNGSRYLFLILLGLVLGAIGAVMLMNAWRARQDPFPHALMHVQAWHMDQLKNDLKQNRCAATDILPHFEALRATAVDLEAAFPKLATDQRFADHASRFRGTLNGLREAPPVSCAGVQKAVADIGEDCKACHGDFNK